MRRVQILAVCLYMFAGCAPVTSAPASLTALMHLQLRERAGLYPPEWIVAGDSQAARLATLQAWAGRKGIIVTDAPIARKNLLGHTSYGGYTGWVILINQDLEPNARLYTLLHELGHVFGPSRLTVASAETFAEMVAAMVCQRFGLDVWPQTASYLAAHVPIEQQTQTVQVYGADIDRLVETLTAAAQ